jgi:hypothetical protein
MRPLKWRTTTPAIVKQLIHVSAIILVATTTVGAQAFAPLVTMSITPADGQTQDITAHESGLATLRAKDGAEYGFRPTIQDSMPFNRVVVTIFKTATANTPSQVLAAIEVKKGAPAVESKTNPSFKVAVRSVSTPSTTN